MSFLNSYTSGLVAKTVNMLDGTLSTSDFDSAHSGQSRVSSPIKRMEFVYKGTTFKFKLNPEEYTQSEPNRVTVTQTKGGAWLDAWGGGIIEITIKGTTGVKGNTLDIDVGYRRFKELRRLFRSIYSDAIDGKEITELLKFYNYTDNEYYYCYPKPEGITLYRSKAKPNIYQYSIGLYALRRIGEPEKETITLGNPVKPQPPATSPSKSSEGSGQKTSSTQNSKYIGGSSSVVSKISTLSQSDSDTMTYTKTKPNAHLIFDAGLYSEKLAPLLGGKDGKFSPATSYQCCSGITMQVSGTVSNVKGFYCTNIEENLSLLQEGLQFIPKCSPITYQLYSGIKSYSKDYISLDYTNITGGTVIQRIIQAISLGTKYDSKIYETAKFCKTKGYINKLEFNQIKIIMLESMSIYKDIYEIGKQVDIYAPINSNISTSQIQTLLNNIDSLIFSLKENSKDFNKFYRLDICNYLRELNKLLMQINMDIVSYM